jgi:LmbE family N-acetylglucosaminyl deacetylase
MNPYRAFVRNYENLVAEAKRTPLGGLPPAPCRTPAPDAPEILIFSPHPDDECIVGGLALRFLREAGYRVTNVAVTLGSNRQRQQPRLEELKAACAYLGFGLCQTTPTGLEGVSAKVRAQQPEAWRQKVEVVAGILRARQPRLIFLPHDADWNSTHVGTHHLVMDALRTLAPGPECHLVETEFWGAMADPNLMVQLTAEDVGDMVAGITFHVEEVKRNPYHLTLPAWMHDNVRRGGELVGGQGQAAPDFCLATLYRFRQWKNGTATPRWTGGRTLHAQSSPLELLA